MINSRDSEPWSYGEKVEEISRNYIQLRYRLMPYIYSTFYSAATSGIPVARSLAIIYPFDQNVFDTRFENQYFFGDSILVAPVESDKFLTKIYLPEGEWFDFYNDNVFPGGIHIIDSPIEKLPVFIPASSIIPSQSLVYSAMEKPLGLLEIHIYKGRKENSFTYYEDDGESYDYENKRFYKRMIAYSGSSNEVILSEVEGNFETIFSKIRIYFHGFDVEELKHLETSHEHYRFINPLSNFDPGSRAGTVDHWISDLQYVEVENGSDEITISW